MEKYDLDELDDLLLGEEDLIEYQILLEGYDENDSPVEYSEIVKILKDEDAAVAFAENYNETLELSLNMSAKNVSYLRLNVIPVIKFDEFEETEDLIYSRVILVK